MKSNAPLKAIQRVVNWLRFGDRGFSSGQMYFGYAPTRKWTLPFRVVQAMQRERRMQPVPLLYVIVGGAGTVFGILLRGVLRRTWWLVPLLAVVSAWGYFFSTIWWPLGWRTRSLRTVVLREINPEAARIREEREDAERVRASGLPRFVVCDWDGQTSTAGYEQSGRKVTALSESFTVEEQVRVLIHVSRDEPEQRARGRAIITVVEWLMEDATEPETPEESFGLFEQLETRVSAQPTHPSVLMVDGKPLTTTAFLADGVLVQYAQLDDGYWVSVVSRGDEEVELCRANRA